MSDSNLKNWASITAGLAGGLAASACCILPLVFLSVGVSGAWIGNLTALSAYHGVFVGFAVLCLAMGHYFVHKARSAACDPTEACARPLPNKLVSIALWLATVLVAVAAVFPYLANYFLGE